MKTTLELPDELFAEAKAVALRRRMTLKALFTRALERELRVLTADSPPQRFTVDESGWPVLRSALGDDQVVSETLINALRDAEEV